jgi:hypothetical protein
VNTVIDVLVLGNSGVAKRLAASQEECSSVELVTVKNNCN